jgi:hypothetical protein
MNIYYGYMYLLLQKIVRSLCHKTILGVTVFVNC